MVPSQDDCDDSSTSYTKYLKITIQGKIIRKMKTIDRCQIGLPSKSEKSIGNFQTTPMAAPAYIN
jgi:hypothetical protein